ncbi:unnamed protein product, partial [Allacma fusca]
MENSRENHTESPINKIRMVKDT